LASGAILVAPGALGLVLLLVSKALAGAETPSEGSSASPPICAGWHRGDGQSRAFDLDATERGYREFRESLSQSLSKSIKDQVAKASPAGYDAGLPSCMRGAERRVTPTRAVPDVLRGRRLWFFSFASGKTPRVPKDAENDRDLVALASKVEKLEDLAKLSKTLGRPVSLAPKGLGETLGVRCLPALVAISKEGEVEIHEDP
jgi:hypothetical protein